MRRSFLFIAIILIFISVAPTMAASANGVTQGEFVARLVSAMKWEGGRTELKEPDYLTILSGKRTFKYEAEETYDAKGDSVSVRTYNLFGPFSGIGWVSGISVATPVHMTIFLPLEGEYTLIAASKGDGQVWQIGEKSFTVNAGGGFREVEAGKLFLKAGTHKVVLQLPPEGAVDYMILKAPPLQPIEPLSGWKFDAPLRMHQLAEVETAMLALEASLPATKPRLIEAAGLKVLPSSVTPTTVSYLGEFFAKKWLRAGINGTDVDIPVEIPEPGFYSLRLHSLGKDIKVSFSDTTISIPGQPYMVWADLGGFRLRKGVHTLHVSIPPGGGIDVLELSARVSAATAYMSASGLKGDPEKIVSNSELDGIISSIVTRFTGRK
jgi:hypothetical protein